ncbi:PTH2 family peptidyl-tRNA hydrolase [Methanohalophilus levihalophilus]|uniref:peptidyl-tRNA hydrolase Pth2 n=1 Tax=Methanohalophilus levihalophilus TaxID=1431282 RepID=UPI001AE5E023|nr:peptidyl-tRNA hydrolase Pth2 [Methanohalophilus levihalophilus]MBP2030999.1 PTH2 family peptidyl-tRNA hydrolase [Methanohalophilus levihalophilus]
MDTFQYKQCIVIREDLKLSRGKLAVQVAHAAVSSMRGATDNDVKKWMREGQKKVVLKAPTEKDLFRLKTEAEMQGLSASLIRDAGLTEIPPNTVTALGIGPAKADDIDRVTGDLKLL